MLTSRNYSKVSRTSVCSGPNSHSVLTGSQYKVAIVAHVMFLCACLGVDMAVIAPLLLWLISALVEVHSRTAPYLTFMGNDIPNHGYVNLNTVGTKNSNNVQCHTNLNTCCSNMQGADRGDWYFPNGDKLPFLNNDNIVLSEGRGSQQVNLYYRSDGGISGIYRCDIESIAVNNNNGYVSLFIGLYASGGE